MKRTCLNNPIGRTFSHVWCPNCHCCAPSTICSSTDESHQIQFSLLTCCHDVVNRSFFNLCLFSAPFVVFLSLYVMLSIFSSRNKGRNEGMKYKNSGEVKTDTTKQKTGNNGVFMLRPASLKFKMRFYCDSINPFYTRHMASKYTHVTITFGGKSMLQKINPPTAFQILFPRIFHCLHAIVIHQMKDKECSISNI